METYLSRRRPAKKVTGNLQEVEYDDTRLNEAQLRAAIKALGYTVQERRFNLHRWIVQNRYFFCHTIYPH